MLVIQDYSITLLSSEISGLQLCSKLPITALDCSHRQGPATGRRPPACWGRGAGAGCERCDRVSRLLSQAIGALHNSRNSQDRPDTRRSPLSDHPIAYPVFWLSTEGEKRMTPLKYTKAIGRKPNQNGSVRQFSGNTLIARIPPSLAICSGLVQARQCLRAADISDG